MRSLAKYGLVFFVVLFAGCLNEANNAEVNEGSLNNGSGKESVIEFETAVNDLGSVREGEQVAAWFTYKNSGTNPLIIQDIKAGCGCTVPRWNNEPLETGKSDVIKIIFNSTGKKGAQNIRISVFSNASNPKEELYLKANVESIN
jgi:hypothetical protein